jgi:Predicted kinase related to galactokinase and mevalonate kinase
VDFWDVVIITASSERQADLYGKEIHRRRNAGALPLETRYLVVPDPGDRRIGSGSATLNALAVLGEQLPWWQQHRVLLLHSGGDSRRLPQYSPAGKLFGVLPSRTNPRATTTVFDETMKLSEGWVGQIESGLLVASGDVVLRFDAQQVNWKRPGVTGVAMKLDAETGSHHGVYVVGEGDQVYTFLQKPTVAEVKAAGGLFADGKVAVDIGLLRFDPELTNTLAKLASQGELPPMDLYDEFTRGLTGQWRSNAHEGQFWNELTQIIRSPEHPVPFHCDVVEGEFIHAGTTKSFRSLASVTGGILDSVIGGDCKVGHEAVILECELDRSVNAARGAILHGLTALDSLIEVPENTVVHQLPVETANGQGWVIRAYGVEDDPKQKLPAATWFNRPILETLYRLGLTEDEVWLGSKEQTLWCASLFPVTSPDEAWQCARWMMGYASDYDIARWRKSLRLSLAESALLADGRVLAETRNRRSQGIWRDTVVELAESDADLRPVLTNMPGLAPIAAAGMALCKRAEVARESNPAGLTRAASYFIQAARLLDRAGCHLEAVNAENDAFTCVQDAVREGANLGTRTAPGTWCSERVSVSAPPRIDLGGGWSDTPPFCFDWGGTVLNCALEIEGGYPIETEIERIDEPIIRCIAEAGKAVEEYRTAEELLRPCRPGSVFSIPRAALQLSGIPSNGRTLRETLSELGGGIEIRCCVRLPIGSGLGTSSILSATIIRALAAMSGNIPGDHELSKYVMHLEQNMTTGGGWQDQAGGIFPGAKLLITGPGLRQKIRVQPVQWEERRKEEFCQHLVLFNTGIQRMAKDLLRQIVSRYLARENATIQVLHSIKTLAIEMSYAMAEGDWKHLGDLLSRHWELNQILDPNTTNAPINAILNRARPYIYGAKLAGAGGGGFLMLIARDPIAAQELKTELSHEAQPHSGVVSFGIAEEGLRIRLEEFFAGDRIPIRASNR